MLVLLANLKCHVVSAEQYADFAKIRMTGVLFPAGHIFPAESLRHEGCRF